MEGSKRSLRPNLPTSFMARRNRKENMVCCFLDWAWAQPTSDLSSLPHCPSSLRLMQTHQKATWKRGPWEAGLSNGISVYSVLPLVKKLILSPTGARSEVTGSWMAWSQSLLDSSLVPTEPLHPPSSQAIAGIRWLAQTLGENNLLLCQAYSWFISRTCPFPNRTNTKIDRFS